MRQRGSHIRLRHATDTSRKPLIPDHRTLKPGLLRHLMRNAQVDTAGSSPKRLVAMAMAEPIVVDQAQLTSTVTVTVTSSQPIRFWTT